MYDGSLAGIIDRFSGHKVVTLQFAEDRMPDNLDTYGTVLETVAPKAQLRIPRNVVAQQLATMLAKYPVEDVSVEDPPLEEVIAEVFSQANRAAGAEMAEGPSCTTAS